MRVRIGVIGAGEYGQIHLNLYKELERVGITKLVALAARTPDTIAKMRAAFGVRGYTDYMQMLSKETLDAVAVVTPDHLHRDMVCAAAQRGIHILVEKPMDVTTAGCQLMIDAARDNNVLLQVDFHKRFDPHLRAVKKAIDDGEIGRVQYGYGCMEYMLITSIPNLARWIGDTSPSWLLGIHFYDLFNWLTGDDPVRVYATAVRRKLKSEGRDVLDSVQVKLEYAGGASFALDVCWILPKSFESRVNQQLRLIGDDGIVEVDLQDRGLRIASGRNRSMAVNPDYLLSGTAAGGVSTSGYAVDSIRNFVDNVRLVKDGMEPTALNGSYVSGIDGLKATAIAEAVDRSVLQSEPVAVSKCW